MNDGGQADRDNRNRRSGVHIPEYIDSAPRARFASDLLRRESRRRSIGRVMTREEILSLLERKSAAWAARDAPALARLYAPHAIVTSPTGGVLEGPGEIERVYRRWLLAFPDLRFQADDVLIDGERVVQVAHLSGTHAGEFFGVPATGRKVNFVCALVLSVGDGLIVSERRILDFTGVLVQVGVLKARPATGF